MAFMDGKWDESFLDVKVDSSGQPFVDAPKIDAPFLTLYSDVTIEYTEGTFVGQVARNGRLGECKSVEKAGEFGKKSCFDDDLAVPHGHGRMRYTDGNEYDGQFMCGQLHGYGQFWSKHPDTPYVYSGEWQNGRMHGQGIFGTEHTTFRGEWKDGVREGKGILLSCGPNADGMNYSGDWRADKMDGKGTMWSGSGGKLWVYKGSIQEDQFFGYGNLAAHGDGTSYEGWFLDGKFHGQGCLTAYQVENGTMKLPREQIGRLVGNFRKGVHRPDLRLSVKKGRDHEVRAYEISSLGPDELDFDVENVKAGMREAMYRYQRLEPELRPEFQGTFQRTLTAFAVLVGRLCTHFRLLDFRDFFFEELPFNGANYHSAFGYTSSLPVIVAGYFRTMFMFCTKDGFIRDTVELLLSFVNSARKGPRACRSFWQEVVLEYLHPVNFCNLHEIGWDIHFLDWDENTLPSTCLTGFWPIALRIYRSRDLQEEVAEKYPIDLLDGVEDEDRPRERAIATFHLAARKSLLLLRLKRVALEVRSMKSIVNLWQVTTAASSYDPYGARQTFLNAFAAGDTVEMARAKRALEKEVMSRNVRRRIGNEAFMEMALRTQLEVDSFVELKAAE